VKLERVIYLSCFNLFPVSHATFSYLSFQSFARIMAAAQLGLHDIHGHFRLPEACLSEISRITLADGFAVTTVYNGVWLGDASLDPVWATLNEIHATVFVHPDAYVAPSQGRTAPLIEVAFDTTKTVVEMIYKGIFSKFPKIRFVIARPGGCVPVLSDCLALLGTES
jgi:hypothetical protein